MSVHANNLLLEEHDVKKVTVHNPLEQFVLLAKGTKGLACLDLIKTVLEAPGVYVFAELLAQPNIKEVSFSRLTDATAKLILFSFLPPNSWTTHRMPSTSTHWICLRTARINNIWRTQAIWSNWQIQWKRNWSIWQSLQWPFETNALPTVSCWSNWTSQTFVN